MNQLYKVIDLFSGCGGSAVGFAQAGFDIKVALDIDVHASETFKLNFPNAHVIKGDISNVSSKDLLNAAGVSNGKKIIIIACPPCQGFSTARRKSQCLTDPRNRLIYEFLRIVEEIKPMAFVMENVPGLASGAGKSIFLEVLQRLKEIGYYTVHGIADSADYGVPQKRKRLVLLGTNNKKIRLAFPTKTNRNPDILDSTLPPWNSVKNAIGELQVIKAGEKSKIDHLHVASNLADINLKRIANTPHDGGSRSSWPDDLILECHKKTNGYKDVYGRMKWNSPSPTITGGCVMISKGRYGHPEQDRAISLREAARLQTFPDIYRFSGNVGEIASQIGNAVPCLLAKRIAESLSNSLSLQELNKIENFFSNKNYTTIPNTFQINAA